MTTKTRRPKQSSSIVDAATRAVIDFLAATPEGRAKLHRVACAVREALEGGATILDLVDAVARLTAPPSVPPQPWARFLPMTLEEFEGSGAAVLLYDRGAQVGLWLVAAEAAAKRVEPLVTSLRQIRRVTWAHEELARADVPGAERTVGKLAEVVGARIQEVR